jgi:VWFA-related protein
LELENEDVVKVESKLVNLNVRISAGDPANAELIFQKSDFVVLEDGKPQEIEFFSSAETPFDLILLLDLSGSTIGKIDLIRQSTRRFIEAARPADRIAIVPFSYEAEIISGLTQNRQQLLASLEKIEGAGGSGIWSAIEYSFKKIIKPHSQGRRSAIVIMTDGVDSSLISRAATPPSYPTFMELLETVRNNDTTIIPIYLDTETRSGDWTRKAYRTARRTLAMIAEESGGQVYQAKKIEDLNGVYEKLINDLSRVYSLGYQSSNEVRDGTWRRITVSLPNHPTVSARTRPGYYAK